MELHDHPTLDVEVILGRLLRALKPGIPIIMVSSITSHGADVTLRALSLGAIDFIPKRDFSPQRVRKALAEAL